MGVNICSSIRRAEVGSSLRKVWSNHTGNTIPIGDGLVHYVLRRVHARVVEHSRHGTPPLVAAQLGVEQRVDKTTGSMPQNQVLHSRLGCATAFMLPRIGRAPALW